MLQRTTRRVLPALSRQNALLRPYSQTTTDNPMPANTPNPEVTKNKFDVISPSNRLPSSTTGGLDKALQETPEEGEAKRIMQAPNREAIWSRSQQPRAKAMVGPRFEQTVIEDQPRPLAAIDLIHQQPVRWTKDRIVSCDGGGGPLGHPRIFINVDKPQICWCTYCGVPFAHTHHRKHLESLPSTSYPLEPAGQAADQAAQLPRYDPGEARTGSTETYQTTTGRPLEQR